MNWNLILTVTFAGIIIVFASLILLAVFVYLYPKAFRSTRKKCRDGFMSEQIPDPQADPPQDDDELTAVITAAAAAFSETSYPSKIVVKEIKRDGRRIPVWNNAGRFESLN